MSAPALQYQFSIRDTITAIVDEYARRHKPAAGQLGLFENPAERQKPLFSKSVDDEAGRWVTMRGARVYISNDDGRIMKGPKNLIGKTKEQIEKESAEEGGPAQKPKGLAELGRISGGRADNRQKKLFEELNPGFKFEDDEEEDFKTVEPVNFEGAMSEDFEGAMAEAPSSPADESESSYEEQVLQGIQEKLKAGEHVMLVTNTKATQFDERHADMFRVKNGSLQVQRGKNWDTIAFGPLDHLAAQVGVNRPESDEPFESADYDSPYEPAAEENILSADFVNDYFNGDAGAAIEAMELNRSREIKRANELGASWDVDEIDSDWMKEVSASAEESGADDEEPQFTLDSTPAPSPAKPVDFGKSESTKQGALFDTGKGTGDLKGQELLFNSDAGDLNNPKTMENRVNPFREKMDSLNRKADSLTPGSSAFDKSMASSFPVGVGRSGNASSRRTSKQAAKRIDQSVNNALKSIEVRKQANSLIGQAEAFDRGEIDQHGNRTELGKQKDAEQLAKSQERKQTVQNFWDNHADFMKATLKPGDFLALAANPSNTITVKRVNKTGVTSEGGSKWVYADLIPLKDGKPMESREVISAVNEWKKGQGEKPAAAEVKEERTPAESIQSHLENDDHESAFEAFSKLKKDEVDKVARQVLGIGFYNKSKAQMLESLKRTLPLATKTASEAAQKKEEIDYAEMKLRKAKENQQAHSEDRLGTPIRSGIPEIAYTDPHGEGREEVAKAWQAEVDDAQRELDRVRGVKAEEKPKQQKPVESKEIHQIAKKVGLKTSNQITKKGMGTLVSNIDNGVKTMKEAMKPIATRIFDGIKNHGPNEVAENLLRHTLISGNAEIAFDRAIEEFSKKSSHEGNPLDLSIRDERKLFANEMKKSKKEILAAFRRPPESPDKYSREQLLHTMNTVIDRYVRPESEVVQVDKYAHPLIHAAVGAGAMYLANKAFKSGPLRSVAHAAIGAAMAAWMQSAMAANGIQPAPSSPAVRVSAPATPGQIKQAGNNAVNQIVQNAINQHEARTQAAANAPPSPAQNVAHSISASAMAGISGALPITPQVKQPGDKPGWRNGLPVMQPLRDPEWEGPMFGPGSKRKGPMFESESAKSQSAGKAGATAGKLPVTEPASASGSGSFNADHPRHPAGAPGSKGGEFAPKGEVESGSSAPESPSSPAVGDSPDETPSPRNYPDNLNKPTSEQTDYSPPERSIEPTEPTEAASSFPKINKPIHTGERQSRKAAWEKHLQGVSEMITEKKEAAKAEKQQAKDLAKATSFNPAELSSPMADDVEPVGEAPKEEDFDSAKDYENALEKHNRAKGAKQATIKKRSSADLIPEIAGQYDLNHDDLQKAVDDEIQMLLPYHNRKEEARQYISKMGWNARRINQAEDRGVDSSSTKFDDVASQWAGMFPEIAGSDESEWVARMWDLSKEGAQDPPSASDEELVNRVAKRLADSGASFSPAEDEGFEYADPGPVSGEIGDVDYTPFHRKAVVDLIVDRYMRLAGIA